MQPTDKRRFAVLLTGIADYYGKELATSIIGLYWRGLEQYDIEAVEKALWTHTQSPDTGQFMPKIADVVRILQGTTIDQAAIAWAKVDSAVRCVGTYRDVVFDDPIIHRVIADMGGWIPLGMKEDKEWPFVAKEFETRYRGYKMRGEIPEYQPVLTGIANAHNQVQGYAGQEPILIGDAANARKVLAGGTTQPLISMRPASEAAPELRRIK
jgi:hypothetical protein